jgi:hypothetical protein
VLNKIYFECIYYFLCLNLLIFLVFYSYFQFIPTSHFYFQSPRFFSFSFFSFNFCFYSSLSLLIRYYDSFSSLDFKTGTKLLLYLSSNSLSVFGLDLSFVLNGRDYLILDGIITGWKTLSALLTSLLIISAYGY